MSSILVLSPHPDDEAIGCGGTLRKHVIEGDKVHVIFLTSGERGGHGMSPEETRIVREQEASDASKILGYEHFEFWRIPNGKLVVNKDVISKLIKKFMEFNPAAIYVTHDKEMHLEHKAAARIVKKAMEFYKIENVRPFVYMYEVWTPIQQIDHIVDISDFVENKRTAIQAHKSQCNVMSFDEAILGLNRYRGEMHSWPGGDYAEVFSIMKFS